MFAIRHISHSRFLINAPPRTCSVREGALLVQIREKVIVRRYINDRDLHRQCGAEAEV